MNSIKRERPNNREHHTLPPSTGEFPSYDQIEHEDLMEKLFCVQKLNRCNIYSTSCSLQVLKG